MTLAVTVQKWRTTLGMVFPFDKIQIFYQLVKVSQGVFANIRL